MWLCVSKWLCLRFCASKCAQKASILNMPWFSSPFLRVWGVGRQVYYWTYLNSHLRSCVSKFSRLRSCASSLNLLRKQKVSALSILDFSSPFLCAWKGSESRYIEYIEYTGFPPLNCHAVHNPETVPSPFLCIGMVPEGKYIEYSILVRPNGFKRQVDCTDMNSHPNFVRLKGLRRQVC